MVASAVPFAWSLWLLSASMALTPSPSTSTRESFIGTNKTAYFTYLMVRDYPGSYYAYTDSLYLCRYSLETGERIEKHLLRRTEYRDTTTEGTWSSTEKVESPLNAQKYLAGARVKYGFPMPWAQTRSLVPRKEGVYLQGSAGRVLLYDAWKLRERLGKPDGALCLVSCYETRDHYFLLIQASNTVLDESMDDCFAQVIIQLDRGTVERARIALHEAARQPRPEERGAPTGSPVKKPRYAVYVVQPGDTLSGIALAVYGKRSELQRIVDANPGLDPDHIQIGQTLQLPPREKEPAD